MGMLRFLTMIVGLVLIQGCMPSHSPSYHQTGFGKMDGAFNEADHTKRLCVAVANYIAASYHSVTPNSLPVQHERTHKDNQENYKGKKPAFVSIKIPSRYEVIFQHKGYQATLDYCFERHQNRLL